ncbi:MAG TPA: hypothetical protein VD887_09695 [Allosphingosinicella sp.]|nr:hypothetical protein [Allosphingosinicella sp.]
MRFLILVLLLVGCSSPARADLTAHYRHVDGSGTVRVEVAGNGDARFEMSGQPWRLIHRSGVSYVVYLLPGGPLVARIDDLRQLATEHGGEPPSLAISSMRLVPRGEVRMGGFSGRAYHLQMPDGPTSRPQLVVSQDPALAPIGQAWLRQIDFSMAMLRARGAPVPDAVTRIREVLTTGSPIYYGGQQLQRIDNAAIPAERFRLPAEPVTLDELRNGAAQSFLGPTV